MKDNDVQELFNSLIRSYELLSDSSTSHYLEYNVCVSARIELRGLITDLIRDYPELNICTEDIHPDILDILTD